MRTLLANRRARIYLCGQLFSLLGDNMLFLAMGIWVKTLTGSSAKAGLTFFFLLAPSVLAPLTGLLVDRRRRRPLLLATNLFLAAAVLPLLAVRTGGQVWLIYAVMLIHGGAYLVLSSGQVALLATMLPDHLLGVANSSLALIRNGLRLVAPLAGAGLFAAFGARVVVALDSATFLIAAGSLMLLRVAEQRPRREPLHWRTQVAAGLVWLRHAPAVRQLIIACALGWSILGLVETLIYPVATGLHRPPTFVGVLVSLQGAGAVLGALSAPPAMRRLGEGRVTATALIGSGVGWGALIPANLALTVPALLLAGLAITWIGIGANTLIQRRTPPDVLGRVDAVAEVTVTVPQTIFIAAGAALVAAMDYRLLLALVTMSMVASGTWLATRPEQRLASRVPDSPATAPALAAPE
jgi:MFS family permease